MLCRCLSLLAVMQVGCRSPLPPSPGQPSTKPTPDAGLPGNDEPSIDPDTGNPVGPSTTTTEPPPETAE